MPYPTDVQAALDHAGEQGWTVECYQAALALALHHLDSDQVDAHPEVVVMFAEEDIDWAEVSIVPNWRDHTIEAGGVYLVCPVCCGGGEFVSFSDGTEYANLRIEDVGDGFVIAARSDFDFSGDGDFGLSHQSGGCYARLSTPEWFDFE